MEPAFTNCTGMRSRNEPSLLRKVPLGVACVVFCVACFAASGQQRQVALDPAQTKIEWTLGDVLHTVHGTFQLKSSNVVFDAATGDASGQVVVDAKSGESGNGTRDRKMHKEVLESARYPEIVFLPRHVTGSVPAQGSSTLQVQGTFRIHGTDHDFTLPVQVTNDGSHVTATTRFELPYEAWGMKNPSTLFLRVNNKVEIDISTVATIQSAVGASAQQ